MMGNGGIQFTIYIIVLLACVRPLGGFMARVYLGEHTFLHPLLAPLERLLYRLAGVDPEQEMDWKQYAAAVLFFGLGGFVLLYAILRLQEFLPFNPQHFAGVSADLAFNTAASFITNTDWQSYGGEATLSYFSQMTGLAVQNFISAATGMAILVALIRGFTRKKTPLIGNFWADMLRGNLYILLPLSLIFAVVFGSQGVVQTLKPSAGATLMESMSVPEQKYAQGNIAQQAQTVTEQSIALGPVASQVAIKQLGTNGGGFFNANSAHPFENPTPLSNFLEMLAILLIPAALTYTFGRMAGDTRQGWTVLAAMTIIFIPLALACIGFEQNGNPRLASLGIDQTMSPMQPGGNMEGKETRFGIVNSALWASATTAASNGSVNSMHDSFTPLGALVPMLFMKFGEVIYGGVGSGLYGMLIFVIVAVFISGLMVGRTPEYLGKKIQAFEVKMASIVVLAPHIAALLGTAVAVSVPAGVASIANPGAHGFAEILYAFSSAANNNGSAFAGLNANTPFYNTALGLAMLFGRYWVIVPVLAIAGSLAGRNTVPVSAGTLPTHTPLFIIVLVSVVVMVGVLTFVPALALGPIAEYFNLML
ncbi:MAG: potassium-transporting ATPase subunit KdpA [Pseudomonadota bacterium]|nr:potassium-transporting ATPase subunit KdpA [Pseudomonadota bacterium]